jgi:hypothetical protein
MDKKEVTGSNPKRTSENETEQSLANHQARRYGRRKGMHQIQVGVRD